MASKNRVGGTNNGVQIGSVRGDIRVSRGSGRIVINGTTNDDCDGNVTNTNTVDGDFDGVQIGEVRGNIVFD